LVAALGVGEQSEKLLTIFKVYDTSRDETGIDIFIDLGLHSIKSVFNLMLVYEMAIGGILFGIYILGSDLNFSVEVGDLANSKKESEY